MSNAIAAIRDAIINDAPAEEFASLELPTSVRGAMVMAEDQEMFGDLADDDRDPRKAVKVQDFPLPELAPDDCGSLEYTAFLHVEAVEPACEQRFDRRRH